MTDLPLHSENCPSKEELSAWFDGMSSSPSETALHIRTCESCRKFIDELKQIDSAVKHFSEQVSDEEISSHILARVKAGIENAPEEQNKRFAVRRALFLRAASLVFIAGVVGYFIWLDSSSKPRTTEEPASTMEHSAAVPAELKAAPAALARKGRGLPSSDRAVVQSSELSRVGFSAVPGGNVSGAEESAAEIPDYVRHVWNMPKPEDASIAILSKIAADTGIPAFKPKRTANGFSILFRATKMQTVLFVRACGKNDFQLLSPEQPQPEQNTFGGKADDLIDYSASFVKK